MIPNYDAIPQGLRDLRRWVTWIATPDAKAGRVGKKPADLQNRPFPEGSGWNRDPQCWSSFEEVRASGFPIGIVLGDGLAGIDIDHCVQDGVIEHWARRLAIGLQTYFEISPSGTGIKIFLSGTLPKDSKAGARCGLEIYDRLRFFTVTGVAAPGAATTIEARESELRDIHAAAFGDDLVAICKLRGLWKSETAGNVHITCPWSADHSGADGPRDAGLQVKDGRVVGFHCFHAHCAGRTLTDVRKVLGVQRKSDEMIERLNQQYAVLGVGNKIVVAEFGAERELVELWPFEEFRRKLIKSPAVKIGKRREPLADYWLRSPEGRQHNRLVYVMAGSRERLREGDYNGYQGFTVAPAPGDWSKNRDHLLTIVCRGDQRIFEWVLNWLAALVQLPGQHAWSAIVLRGEQGTGKGHFADAMIGQCFYPQQYLHLVGANQLTAEFNEHFSGKVFVFGDETCWGGEKQAGEKLKGMITEDTIQIHRKFLKAVEEPSALHIVMASNSEWPVAIPKDDRRFLVLDVASDQRQNQEYFGGLRRELEAGGRAAMLHDLLQVPVNTALLRQPPDTDAKLDVKARTFHPEEAWVQNWLMNVNETWTNRIGKGELYDDYKFALPRNTAPRSIEAFGKIFKRLGIDWREGKVEGATTSRRVNAYIFPALADCRKAFDRALGVKTDWPSDCPGDDEPGSQAGQERLPEVA